jgi:uncharacterized protein
VSGQPPSFDFGDDPSRSSDPMVEAPHESPHSVGTESKRHWGGWIILAVLFTFLVGTQLDTYLTRERAPQRVFEEQERALRMLVTTRGMQAFAERMARQAPSQRESRGEAAEALAELDQLKDRHPEALALSAIFRRELGREIPAEDLKRLAEGERPEDRALAEVYGAETLTEEAATRLVAQMDRERYSFQLAEVHALEAAGVTDARERLIPQGRLMLAFGVLSFAALLGALGVVLWLGYLVGRAMGKFQPEGLPMQPLSKPDADRLAMRAAQGLGVFVLFAAFGSTIAMALRIVSDADLEDTGGGIRWTAVIGSLLVAAGIVYLHRTQVFGKRITLADIGLHRRNLGRNVLLGFAGVAMNLPVVAFLGFLGQWLFRHLPSPEHPAATELQGRPGILAILTIFVLASLLAPFIEEIIFRGALYPALQGVLKSPLWAVVASSLLFAAVHPTGIPAWFALAGVGAVSCFLVYHTRSLVPSIVMHALHNTFVLSLNIALF